MNQFQFIRALFQQSSTEGSRSSALRPIGWALALFLSGMLASIALHAPGYVVLVMVVLCILTFVLYAVGFVFFMVRNPDALRSEWYSITKMQIQRGLSGDSAQGVLANKEVELLPGIDVQSEVGNQQ